MSNTRKSCFIRFSNTDKWVEKTLYFKMVHVQSYLSNFLFFLDVGENWQNRSFDWTEYLKKTGAKAAPTHLFGHVSRYVPVTVVL